MCSKVRRNSKTFGSDVSSLVVIIVICLLPLAEQNLQIFYEMKFVAFIIVFIFLYIRIMDTLMNVTLTYLNRLSIASFEAFPKALLTRSNPLMDIRNNPKLFIIILFILF